MRKNKTPAQALKRLTRLTGQEFKDAYDDGYPVYGESSHEQGKPPTPEEVLGSASVSTVLAISMLHAMLPTKVIARIQAPPSLALVVSVPGPDWIGPIAHALTSLRAWTEVIKRDGSKKISDNASVGGDSVASALGAGRSVVGVTTAPDRYLPAALVATADLRIELKSPSPKALRATIRLVTGRRPGPLPADLIRGLGFNEIAACIRRGSRPRDCVRRLKAASASRTSAPDLKAVPLLRDTVGYGAAQTHGLALIDAVEAYRRGERSWASIEGKNIVLAGPPGTGKTTYARSVAKSLGVNLTVTSVSSWFAQTNGYLNDICRKVDEVFLEASQNGGVLLIDELDSLPCRDQCDSRHRDYWVTVVNHVLMTLDGAVSSPASKLIIIGATNYPERLDAALTRPGRLDRIVRIDLPDEAAIEGILRQHLAGDLADEDLAPLAAIGAGATGADIAGWASGARMVAMAAKRRMVMADLIGRIAPPETRSTAELLAVARHEAGHALALTVKGCAEVSMVSIVAQGAFAGRTLSRLRDTSKMNSSELDDLVVSVLAGRAADHLWDTVTSGSAGGSGSDLAHATALVAAKHASLGLGSSLLYRGDQETAVSLIRTDPVFRRLCEDDLSRLYEISRDLVSRHTDRIDRIAHRLVERRVLGGDEVRAIIAGSPMPAAKGTRKAGTGGVHV
ncbi:AAA family ATPase [Methylobacterium goesingense]|uniref:AAA+ ATPase domain-containing protein n=1 Tax=Methylobacterium goesingense TaxID=243690 RepID=A0ABV2LBN1_9HYPH|nr:AAA family ATPase [Methylobacterium goesingense]GJD75390.1 ATP-dependent zinc metalloprotease FtsH [Methylobacterium goesingense]